MWIKHDGSADCPVRPNTIIDARHNDGYVNRGAQAKMINWQAVTHYRIE